VTARPDPKAREKTDEGPGLIGLGRQHIPSHPAYELFQEVAINVGGQILANGTFQGQNRAFLPTP
jgi:hypothetical protein